MTKELEYWGRIDPEKAKELEDILDDLVKDDSLCLKIKEKYFVKKDGSEHGLCEGYTLEWEHNIYHYLGKQNPKIKILLNWSTIPIFSFGSIVMDYKGNVGYEKKWYHFGDDYRKNVIRKALETEGLLKKDVENSARNMYPLTKLRGAKF
jgi:hypothetical protein